MVSAAEGVVLGVYGERASVVGARWGGAFREVFVVVEQ